MPFRGRVGDAGFDAVIRSAYSLNKADGAKGSRERAAIRVVPRRFYLRLLKQAGFKGRFFYGRLLLGPTGKLTFRKEART